MADAADGRGCYRKEAIDEKAES